MGGGAGGSGAGGSGPQTCLGAELAPFAGGSGTTEDPYRICTLAQLGRVGNGTFKLEADIDASITNPANPANRGSAWDNGGLGWAPLKSFQGVFLGQGHGVSHLYINRPTEDRVGLFEAPNGPISDLWLSSADVTGQNYVGILAGVAHYPIDRCSTSGKVHGHIGSIGTAFAGGLVGHSDSMISRSSSSAQVVAQSAMGGLAGLMDAGGSVIASYTTGSVDGTTGTGGLVGLGYQITILDSYSRAAILRGIPAGGLAGYLLDSTVTNSYARGEISAWSAGGLLGSANGTTTIRSSFGAGLVLSSRFGGGLVGKVLSVSIVNSKWDGTAPRSVVMCGEITDSATASGCDDSQIIVDMPTYWFGNANAPMNGWSNLVWTFSGNDYPALREARAPQE